MYLFLFINTLTAEYTIPENVKIDKRLKINPTNRSLIQALF